MDPEQENQQRQRQIGLLIIAAIIFLAVRQSHLTSSDLFFILLLMPAIICHEVAHGAVANMFGDDTAKRAGRLTLNPLKHIDPFGTILMPLMLSMAGFPPFGYAKPVPVSLSGLRNPRLHGLFVGLAGPATNLCLAALSVVFAGSFFAEGIRTVGIYSALYNFGLLNIFLAMFNLLPIPPLDGSSILEFFLPDSWRRGYYQFRRYAMILLLVLLLSGGSQFSRLLNDLRAPLSRVFDHQFQCATGGCPAENSNGTLR